MNIINIYIGDKIKLLREKKNMSQQELAKKLCCSRASISNIEMGRQSLSIKKLFVIANVLNEDIMYFLPDMNWVIQNKDKKIKKIITYAFYN